MPAFCVRVLRLHGDCVCRNCAERSRKELYICYVLSTTSSKRRQNMLQHYCLAANVQFGNVVSYTRQKLCGAWLIHEFLETCDFQNLCWKKNLSACCRKKKQKLYSQARCNCRKSQAIVRSFFNFTDLIIGNCVHISQRYLLYISNHYSYMVLWRRWHFGYAVYFARPNTSFVHSQSLHTS